MVTAGNEPVNLRSYVESVAGVRWPNSYNVSLQPRFIGYVNASDVNRTSRLNHYEKLTKLAGQQPSRTAPDNRASLIDLAAQNSGSSRVRV